MESVEFMEIQELEKESLSVNEQAHALQVQNREQLSLASEFLKTVKALKQSIAETFDPIIENTRRAWKEAIAQKDKHLDPLEKAEKLVLEKTNFYLVEERKAREIEEARLREQQRKEKEDLDRKAAVAAKNGHVEKAAALQEQAKLAGAATPMASSASAAPTPKGLVQRTDWKFKIVDPKKVPRKFLVPDLQAIGSYVRAMKDKANIPGVQVYPESSTYQKKEA